MPSTRSGRSTKPPDYGESGEQEVANGDSEDEVEDQQDEDLHSDSEQHSKTSANTEVRVLIRENTTGYAMAQQAQNTGGDTKFICSICGRSGLQDRAKLEIHLRRHLKEHICACKYCGRPFYDIGEMNGHVKKGQCLGNQESLPSQEMVETQQIAAEPDPSVSSAGPSHELSITETEVRNNETKFGPRHKTRAWAVAQGAVKTEGKFSCCVCFNTINDRSNLETHLRRHFKEHICFCQSCSRSFLTLSELNIHQQNGCSQQFEDASGNNGHDLNEVMDAVEEASLSVVVPSKFNSEPSRKSKCQANIQQTKASYFKENRSETKAYKMSQRAQRKINGYSCEVCGKIGIRDRYDLEVHLRRHYQSYTCKSCSQEFRDFSKLKRHSCLPEQAENRNIIDGAMKLYKREDTRAFRMSKEVVKTEGQFKCSVCTANIQFPHRGLLEVHLRRHFREYIYSCDSCEKLFCRQWDLKIHKQRHSCDLERVRGMEKEREQTQLGDIDSEMTETGLLDKSKGSNSENRPQTRKFRSRPRVAYQIRKNSASTSSHSRHGSSFVRLSSANLPRNRKLLLQKSNVFKKIGFHQVSRPSSTRHKARVIARNTVIQLCSYCRKSVPAHERKEHRQQHQQNGDKYACKYCDKLFANAKNRSEHELVHTGRVFQCSDCSKEFKYRSSLRTHRSENCHGAFQPAKLEVSGMSKELNFADLGLEALIRESLDLPTLNRTREAARTGNLSHSLTPITGRTRRNANSRENNPFPTDTDGNNCILERKLKCDYCPSAFTSAQLKKCHEKSHASLIRKKRGPGIERLQDSVAINTLAGEKPFECDFCDLRFTHSVQATAHTGSCHGFDIAVSISSLKLQKVQQVPMVVNSAQPISEQKAVLAATALVTHEELNVSEAGHHQQQDTICLEKQHTAAAKLNVCNSEKTETFNSGPKKYQCGYCEAAYTTSYMKRYHENQHKGLTPYQCGVCEKQFYSAITRNNHLKKAHVTKKIATHKTRCSSDQNQKKSNTIIRHECQLCQHVFLSEANYKLHVQNRLCTQDQILGVSLRRSSKLPQLTAELFECSYCAKQFSAAYRLREHEKLHTGDLPFPCSICSRGYNKRRDLQHHLEKVHGFGNTPEEIQSSETSLSKNEVPVAANQLCDAVEETQMESGNSLPRKTSDGRYQCSYCSLTFRRLHHRRYHEYQHTGKKPYKCDVCDQCFTRPTRRMEHRFKAHGLKGPVTSPGCNPERKSFRKSRTKPRDEKSIFEFECSFCNKLFKTVHQKRYHENFHKGLRPYKCDTCDKRFTRPAARVRHRIIAHGLRGKVYTPGCNPALPQFRTKVKVDRFYKCEYCDKKCARLDNLIKHERIHTGEKPYQCSICDKRFTQLTARNQHMRNSHQGLMAKLVPDFASENPIHHNPLPTASIAPEELSYEPVIEIEKVYRCQHCEDEFNNQEILERHVQVVHIEKRPFNCQSCQRGFFAAANYEKHVKNNLCDKATLSKQASRWTTARGNSTVFECSYCSKQFSYKSNLQTHEQRHTGEATFGCPLCSRYFKTYGDRLNHVQRIHGQKKVKQFKAQSGNRMIPTKAVEGSGKRGAEYPCYLCDSGFAQEDLLETHIRDVHVQGRPYQCQDCQRGFFSEAAFQRHERQQLCRKVAETRPVVGFGNEELSEMDTREEAGENGDEEASEADIKPELQKKLQTTKYPWIREFVNGPFIYECEECDAKFTREIIAEDHKRWHEEWDSKLKKSD